MSNTKRIVKKSSNKELQTVFWTPLQSTETLKNLSQEVMPSDIGVWLTSSRRASHVNPLAEPEKNEGETMSATCGLKPLNACESSSQLLDSLKMCLTSLGPPIAVIHQGIWIAPQCTMFNISEQFSETFPKQGIMQDGQCWALTMLAHRTEEKEFGYWRTPSCTLISGGEGRRTKRKAYRESIGRHDVAGSLAEQVAYPELAPATWPTPRVSDTEGAPIKNAEYKNGSWSRVNKKGVRFGIKLKDAVNKFPTPRLSDHKGSGTLGSKSQVHMEKRGYLCGTVATEASGQLNPSWVEALMGMPIGWSSPEPLQTNQFEHWLENLQWEDWEPDIPRVTKDTTNRMNRLKALGNAQVPFCVFIAWNILTNYGKET